eukprot:3131251-Amphidinium_carterae.1
MDSFELRRFAYSAPFSIARAAHLLPETSAGKRHSDVSKEDAEAVKGFLDVPGIDPKVKARWGASAFMRLQPRIVCNNKWDEGAEPGVVNDNQ